MNILSRKKLRYLLQASLIAFVGVSLTNFLHADPYGHIIHRDKEGCVFVEEETGECLEDGENEECQEVCYECVKGRRDCRDGRNHIKPGFEEEDVTTRLDDDAAWPSRRENFSEMFR